ncbi:MAG: hypothetical protein WC878_06200 [Candidatus Paceibacterota bacterium]|jgi:hypothetical protein
MSLIRPKLKKAIKKYLEACELRDGGAAAAVIMQEIKTIATKEEIALIDFILSEVRQHRCH